MNWRRAKGLIKATNQCPICHGEFPDDEYDLKEDMCLYCEFPETTKARPVEVDAYGNNYTKERKLLDNLENTFEKQSKQAEKNRNNYKNRKLYKQPLSVHK